MAANQASKVDREKLQALLDKLMAFATTAEAVALRLVGKVRTLALIGLGGGLWLTYALTDTFNMGTSLWLAIGAILIAAPLILLKMSGTLQDIVGLPQRITDTANSIMGKAKEARAYYANSQAKTAKPNQRPTLRQLWHSTKWMLGAKALGDDAQRLVGQAAGALVVTNPIFAVVLVIASVLSVLMIAIAVIVLLAYLF